MTADRLVVETLWRAHIYGLPVELGYQSTYSVCSPAFMALASPSCSRSQLPVTTNSTGRTRLAAAGRPFKPFPASISFSSTLGGQTMMKFLDRCGSGGSARATTCSIVVSTENLKWVATGASAVLLLAKNTGVRKPLLVPFVSLMVPAVAINWIRGEYGLWLAFMGLLIRLFFKIPDSPELGLLLDLLLLVNSAPDEIFSLRRQTVGVVVSIMIASVLAYQHFTRGGGLEGALQKGAFVPSTAVILLLITPIALLLQLV